MFRINSYGITSYGLASSRRTCKLTKPQGLRNDVFAFYPEYGCVTEIRYVILRLYTWATRTRPSLANARNKYSLSEEKLPTVHRYLSAPVLNNQSGESYQPSHKQYRTNAAQTHEARLRQYRWALRLGPVLHALVPLPVDSIAIQYHAALFIQSDAQELICRSIRQFQFGI